MIRMPVIVITMATILLCDVIAMNQFVAESNITNTDDNATIPDQTGQPSGNGDDSNDNGGRNFIGDDDLPTLCAKHNIPDFACNCETPPGSIFCDIIAKRDKDKETIVVLTPCFETNDKIKGSLVIFVSVFGLIGNSLVMMVTFVNWKKSNSCHKLIGGLALCDFIFAIFQLVEAAPMLTTCHWKYGDVMCRLITGVYNLSAWVAMGFILIIAIERYNGIVRPFARGLVERQLYFLLLVVILLGIALISPMLVYLKVAESKKCAEEWPSKEKSSIYSWFLMFIGFLIPLAFISVLYGRIVLALQRGSSSKVLNDDQQKRRAMENKRIMTILISILVCFVLLVFPIRIIWLLYDHGALENVSTRTFNVIQIIGIVSYSFHVAVNPVIYSVVDRKFRMTILRLFNVKYSANDKSMDTSSTSQTAQSKNSKKPLHIVKSGLASNRDDVREEHV